MYRWGAMYRLGRDVSPGARCIAWGAMYRLGRDVSRPYLQMSTRLLSARLLVVFGMPPTDELYHLTIDLHINNPRQGPGGDAETLQAIHLAGLSAGSPLQILDIGCGTGAQTLVLAEHLNAHVTAVDWSPEFLEVLQRRAEDRGVAERIGTVCAEMESMDLEPASFDVIWAEGSVYNMGFERGIRTWRNYLKSGGTLAVSEIAWLQHRVPEELAAYWNAAYSGMGTVAQKLDILENAGYAFRGAFTLPEHCWTTNYLEPLEGGFDAFLQRHPESPAAKSLVDADQEEIDIYRRFHEFFGYVFFVASHGT